MTLSVVDPHVHYWDTVPGNHRGLDRAGDGGFIGDWRPMAVPYFLKELRTGADDVEI